MYRTREKKSVVVVVPLYCLESSAHVIFEGVPPFLDEDVVPSVEFIFFVKIIFQKFFLMMSYEFFDSSSARDRFFIFWKVFVSVICGDVIDN